ncbi:GNAT family N-acetyltransferase [Candidatus Bathyarchaeota archaeon]|nr:GNAT family N-acetyltransferase [Candidatus Bathyarchaeota archaeon]
MMTVIVRDFAAEDIARVLSLLNAKRHGSHEFVPLTEEKLLSWIQEGRLSIFVAEEDTEIMGTSAYHDGHWGEEVEWVVASNIRNGKTVENALVAEVEKRVKKGQVFAIVDEGSPVINDWTLRGYRPEGGLYQMVADLGGVKPLPKLTNNITVRSLKSGEETEFVCAVNAGFGWERLKPGEVQKWKAETPYFNEEWIHVAECDGKIVTVVVAKQDMEYNRSFKGSRGYLGPAATLPEYRGRNLASALTCRAMNFLCEKGMSSVALYTQEQNVASVALLRKLGFRVGHHWKFMRKSLTA